MMGATDYPAFNHEVVTKNAPGAMRETPAECCTHGISIADVCKCCIAYFKNKPDPEPVPTDFFEGSRAPFPKAPPVRKNKPFGDIASFAEEVRAYHEKVAREGEPIPFVPTEKAYEEIGALKSSAEIRHGESGALRSAIREAVDRAQASHDTTAEIQDAVVMKWGESLARELMPVDQEWKTEESAKPTNPKDALGILKAPSSTIPANVKLELGLALLEGACKYRRHNYRIVGVRGSVYYDATMRHLDAWWEGEDLDPDSGLSHVTKAIASLVVLRDAMMQEKFVDDRPPACADKEWMRKLNEKTRTMLAKYPDPKPPCTNGTEDL